MKPEELQIGDWVKTDEGTFEIIGLIGSTVTLKSENKKRFDEFIDQINPIPLTAEILEKNGFEQLKETVYVYHKIEGDGYVKVKLYDLRDGEWSVFIDNYNKFDKDSCTFSIVDCFLKIHELQNALRICGINKKIEI